MFKTIVATVVFSAISLQVGTCSAGDNLSPYFSLGSVKEKPGKISDSLKTAIQTAITDQGFEVLGSYSPAASQGLWVIAFTNSDIRALAVKAPDRGILAAAQRIAVIKDGSTAEVTALNPDYLFTAYFGNQIPDLQKLAKPVYQKLEALWKNLGSQKKPFGGSLDRDDLKEYHYMMGMPYFDDPVELGNYASFSAAVAAVSGTIKKNPAGIQIVYSVIDEKSKQAVFGVGLADQETGEAHFLPIIGKRHCAALPYELVISGSKVTMLHGRYRFALYWPELTMGTFTKIMSTPGDVETSLQKLVK